MSYSLENEQQFWDGEWHLHIFDVRPNDDLENLEGLMTHADRCHDGQSSMTSSPPIVRHMLLSTMPYDLISISPPIIEVAPPVPTTRPFFRY